MSQAESVAASVADFYEHEKDGWCTPEKAAKIAELCLRADVMRCVEIGVFTGRSLLPAALALAEKGVSISPYGQQLGFIVGVDPYDAAMQVEGFGDRADHDDWGRRVPWEELYSRALGHIRSYRLEQHCGILRTPSHSAANLFPSQSLDYVHVDGNHSAKRSFEDATLWLDRVRIGGYLIFDDVNWDTTQDAVRFLDAQCETVFKSSPDWWTIYRRDRL